MSAIGPYAGNAVGGSSPAHEARFDYFRSVWDSCPSDLNIDGVVDTADLGFLIGQFGASRP